AVREARADKLAKLEKLSLDDIWKDDEARQFAVRMGEATFKLHCVQCHGAGAQGGFGYPNLRDDDWLWGGTLDAIHYTITHGIRYNPDTNEDTRTSDMPAFGEQLSPEQIDAVSEYVLQLAGLPHDAKKGEAGKKIFMEDAGCNGCHGDKGEGIQDVGGPRLADKLWLYSVGSDPGAIRKMVVEQITTPRHGVMPAWKDRLDPATIKSLAIYVYSLGGGAKS
ncbi:MAG TPA: cytochrome-c oxidase, cbb3-type subunit III, partial [Thermopetrobacter sp.]|nr:cytochrome-c oxidase, cbb3-type subunit III [Thermopetrobacter sp.]